MNEISKKAGLKGINANKVKSAMSKYYDANEMHVMQTVKVEDEEGNETQEMQVVMQKIKVKDDDGEETGDTTEKPKLPMFRDGPHVYLASVMETVCCKIFELALKQSHTNSKDKKEINRTCVKRVIRSNKSLRSLFLEALDKFDKAQSYDSVISVSIKDIEKLLEDDNGVMTKKCKIFMRYLLGFIFDKFTHTSYITMTKSLTKSITSADVEAATKIFITGSMFKPCSTTAKKATVLAMTKDEDEEKEKKKKKKKGTKKGAKKKSTKGKKKVKKDDDDDEDEDKEIEDAREENEEEEEEEADDDDDKKKKKKAKAKAKVE